MAAAEGDRDGCGTALREILRMGESAVHVALCDWSRRIRAAVAPDGPPGGFWVLEPVAGDALAPESESPADRGLLDALRVAACAGNGDHAMVAAIIGAAAADGPALGWLLARSVQLAARPIAIIQRTEGVDGGRE
jgi:hypothetical protein